MMPLSMGPMMTCCKAIMNPGKKNNDREREQMMRRDEQGFSTIKLMLGLAIIFCAAWVALEVVPVYNANWKIQDTFDGVVRNMSDADEAAIRKRLPDLYKIKYLAPGDVPQAYYDNLQINADGNGVSISSNYHVTIWLMGPVQEVDPESDYSESDLKGMDKIRHKLRIDLDFEPYAETP